jgi:hypothetical protein
MTAQNPLWFIIGGLALAVLGVMYDALFAGLPYQDPTPEMQADWLFHGKVAGWIMWSGSVILLTGCVWSGLRWVKRRSAR